MSEESELLPEKLLLLELLLLELELLLEDVCFQLLLLLFLDEFCLAVPALLLPAEKFPDRYVEGHPDMPVGALSAVLFVALVAVFAACPEGVADGAFCPWLPETLFSDFELEFCGRVGGVYIP
ncbi:MAG: hypothetical protein IJ828_01635 [Treponema sp.]|nr:hypothetical protein [Treponema sp.]